MDIPFAAESVVNHSLGTHIGDHLPCYEEYGEECFGKCRGNWDGAWEWLSQAYNGQRNESKFKEDEQRKLDKESTTEYQLHRSDAV